MSQRQRRGLIWSLTILLVGIGVLTLWAWQSSRHSTGAPPSAVADAAPPTVELLGSRLTHYDAQGHRLWTVSSDALRYQKEVEQTTAQDVQVQFFSADRPALQLRAARFVFFNQSGDLALNGKLLAQDERQGLRFQTEEANWLDREGVLRGEGPLEIERNDLTLQGAGFSYWPAEDKLQVQSAQLRFWPRGR